MGRQVEDAKKTSAGRLEGEVAAMEYFDRRKPSYLPFYIFQHGLLARKRLFHARSKEHALKHIDIRIGWLAIFWLLIFIIVMTILVTLLKDLVLTYMSNPIATQILSENEILLFPDVTICPVAPFSNSSLLQEDRDELERLKSHVVQKLKYAGLHPGVVNVQAAMLIHLATQRHLSELRSYEHLMYCAYNGEHCSFANFTEVVHLRYLKCFTFSPREAKRRVTVGAGLTFVYAADQNGNSSNPYMLLNDLESHMFDAPNYDGINIFVHNPGTFPGYEISSMPTSFAVHFGQIARVHVTGLQLVSTTRGYKKCRNDPKPYKYTSFGGPTKYLEYKYTYEDCVANRKQSHILETCGCYSDLLHVPHAPEPDDDPQAEGTPKVLDLSHMKVDFCRDLRERTSQQARVNFECHERLSKLPTFSVLDAYINSDLLWESRDDPDKRKFLRQEVCPANCLKMLYRTSKIELSEMNEQFIMRLPLITKYMMDLNLSTLDPRTAIHQKWSEFLDSQKKGETKFIDGKNVIIIDIRLRSARVDTWNEEVTSSLFSLMANIGGTLGLCAGISFLSALFLLIFFGNAFYHAIMVALLWFWWNIFQGQPKAASVDELSLRNMRTRKIENEENNVRPFRSSGHMRAVSTQIQKREKSVVYDPWVAAQLQYGRPKSVVEEDSNNEHCVSHDNVDFMGTSSTTGDVTPAATSPSKTVETATDKPLSSAHESNSHGENSTLHTSTSQLPLSRQVEEMLIRLRNQPEPQLFSPRNISPTIAARSNPGELDNPRRLLSPPEIHMSECSPIQLRCARRDDAGLMTTEGPIPIVVATPTTVPDTIKHFIAYTSDVPG